MANMSYCRFHNTMLDMRDCLNAIGRYMEDEVTDDHLDFRDTLSNEEKRAYDSLIDMARELVNIVDEDGL